MSKYVAVAAFFVAGLTLGSVMAGSQKSLVRAGGWMLFSFTGFGVFHGLATGNPLTVFSDWFVWVVGIGVALAAEGH